MLSIIEEEGQGEADVNARTLQNGAVSLSYDFSAVHDLLRFKLRNGYFLYKCGYPYHLSASLLSRCTILSS